jgi:integrase
MVQNETGRPKMTRLSSHLTRQPPRKALLDVRLVERWSRVPPGWTIVIRDTMLRGFSVRIGASGKVSYALQYISPEGKQRLIILDAPWHPADLEKPAGERRRSNDPAHYRIAAMTLKEHGGDPLEERRAGQDEAAKAKRAAKTIAELCDAWLARREGKRTLHNDRLLIERHIRPSFGHLPVARLHADQVRRLHVEISADAPYQANRVLALISALWNFADGGVRPRRGSTKRIEGLHWLKPGLPNPAAGVERNEEERRERSLSPNEFARLSAVLREEANAPSAHALTLLMLTAARRSEVLKAEWSQFDLERAIWNRPASLMKAGRIARLPLSTDAVKLLGVMRAQADPAERYLFPSKDHGAMALRRFWDRVRVEAKLPDVRLHDLRRTVASWLVTEGVSMLAVSKMLAHSSIAVTEGHYAHLQDRAGREAAEAVARLVEQHANGTT